MTLTAVGATEQLKAIFQWTQAEDRDSRSPVLFLILILLAFKRLHFQENDYDRSLPDLINITVLVKVKKKKLHFFTSTSLPHGQLCGTVEGTLT